MDADREASLADEIVRAQGGDPLAFRAVVLRTHGSVYRLAVHLAGDVAEAEEVVQETFVRAWRRLGELRDPQAALAWLFRIVRSVAHDHQRARRRRREDTLDDDVLGPLLARVAGDADLADEVLARTELAAAVRREVEALPEKYRLVLLLREVEDMSYPELSAALGVPPGTIDSRLFRARRLLARRLEARLDREGLR